MAKKEQRNVRIVFLGGIGEIGKNMTAIEYKDNILVVDAGMSFPSMDEMPGIDFVIPDYKYLLNNKEKVKGIVITHGHEDHIGAIPFLLRDINVPVYGSKFTLGLVEHKLRERKLKAEKLVEATDGMRQQIGCFNVEFVTVTHSIAGAFALSIDTPQGKIFHTGDFKVDYTPVDGKTINLARIAEIGKEGVTLLMQDSTNVERPGFSMSETNVGANLDSVFAANIGRRLIVATFASNIHRVQQIINCAVKYGRRVAFSGRSMINIAEIGMKLKELHCPPDTIVDIEKIDGIPFDKLCIISTGTQGEPMSALSRMAAGDFKKVKITSSDTVILSSSPIPGNEKMIYNVINNLYRLGAQVVYQSLAEVHVSGHACKEELKLMYSLVHPKYFMPVHGEYRHLKQHAELIEGLGLPAANILIPDLGSVIGLSKKGLVREEKISAGSILIDGSVVSENSDVVLRDRKHLAEDGFVVAMITLSPAEDEKYAAPFVIVRGLNVSDKIEEEIIASLNGLLQRGEWQKMDIVDFKQVIRKSIAKILFSRVKKKPMVLPIVIEN